MTAIDRADRAELLSVFIRHEVRFIVIGGAAIQSHGRRYDTLDIGLTPDREEANLVRLAAALSELECKLVTDLVDPAGWVSLPADYFTPRSLLAASVWNLAPVTACWTSASPRADSPAAMRTWRPARPRCLLRERRWRSSSPRSMTSTRRSALRTGRRTAPTSRPWN